MADFPHGLWNKFYLRINSEVRKKVKRYDPERGCRVGGRNSQNVVFVNITLLLGEGGELLGYGEPRSTRLEPGNVEWIDMLGG